MPRFKALFCILVFAFTTSVYSQNRSKGFEAISKLFNSGNYTDVLSSLDSYKPRTKLLRSEKAYFKGISQSRLEQFDPASKSLVQAINLGTKRKDVFYEAGQAYYGNNDLDLAQKYFILSAKSGFKPSISYYYVAYSSQIQEDFKKAKKYYAKMTKQKDTTKEYLQIAQYQLGEVLLELAVKKEEDKEKQKELVKKHVIKRYDMALKVDPNSRLAKDVEARKKEIIRRFGLDPNQLVSGKMFPKKRHRLTLSQSYKYDNNITLTTNLPSVQDTRKDSYIYETNAGASYSFLFAQRYIITPELKVKFVKHSDRETPEVFEDDRYEIKPALKQRLDHKVFGRAGSFTFDLKHDYAARDQYQIKELKKYSTGNTWTIGEKIGFFRFGDTGLSYSSGDTEYHDPALDYDLTSWTISQTVIRPTGNLFLLTFNYSESRFANAPTNDSDTTMLRMDYIVPKFANQYTFHVGFSVTFLKVLATQATTGTEKTFAPSFKLSKAVRPNVKLSVNYDYSKKVSDAGQSNEYTKHVTGFEISAEF